MAYGTPLRDYPTLAAAAQAAVERAQRFMPASAVGLLFRISAVSYAVSDHWGDWSSTGPRLELDTYPVARWTPCGARLHYSERAGADGKWVDLRPGHKQWASRDPEAALRQFLARRRGQIHILERQISRAKEEHGLAYHALHPGENPLNATLEGLNEGM